MFIGRLNEKLELNYSVYRLNTKQEPIIKENGNPFKKEALKIEWLLSGVDICVSLNETCFIDRVTVYLGEKFSPKYVAVDDAKYSAETGKTIVERVVTVPVLKKTDGFKISMDSCFQDIEIIGIDIFGALENKIELYPLPEKLVDYGKYIPVNVFNTVKCDDDTVYNILFEKFFEKTDIKLEKSENGNIIFKTDKSIKEDGYILRINADHITLNASNRRGFVQAVETVIKLISSEGLPMTVIEDNPFTSFRGAHLYLPAVCDMDFAKNLIKYVLSPMGYNHIILELCGAMEYLSHPEINEKYVEANENYDNGLWPKFPHGTVGGKKIVPQCEIKKFIDFSRSYGIEVIPEIQSLSHVQFMTLAHPEIAEIPENKPALDVTDERLADIPPNDFYAHSFCPSNEKSYEILFDLMEEIIELFKPKKYVHMGHDEVYQIGVCPVCSKKDPAKLFYDDVMRFYNYLKGKNLGMMIWADMLQEASGYKTVPAVKELPKDIVLLDFIWYFHTDKDIEENLIKYGYNVIFGNMYSSHFPRYESRIRKDRIMGGEVSAWVRTDDHTLNREGKIYDILYTANMLWSEDYDENCRFAYDEIIRKMIPDIRNVLSGAPVYTQGKEFKLNEEINVAADKITFFHYTDTFLSRIPWEENVILGEYTVKYTDGTSETVKVVNSENVGYWGMRAYKPLENGYYRHNGYASPWYSDAVYDSGKTVYRFTWDNPHKNKSIERITFAQYEDAEVNVVIEKIEV